MLKVLGFYKSSFIANGKKTNYTAIVEVDPTSFEKIMKEGSIKLNWGTRCWVYEYIRVVRCFKCHGYSHKAANCTNKRVCGKCTGEHDARECKEESHQCINCVTINNKLNLALDVNHSTYDVNCEVYRQKISQVKGRINYQHESRQE